FSERTIDIVVEPEEDEAQIEEPVADETPEPEETPESTPGFGLAASMTGVLIWAYNKRRGN
ncbi:MAG: hypothetical protein KAT05_04525, partial [Spirochaetes bacterium]|nr:hypothetical protein [Spirochaetota bacterium]